MNNEALDFFNSFSLEDEGDDSTSSIIEEPEISYPEKMWGNISPVETAAEILSDEFTCLEILASSYPFPAQIISTNSGSDIIICSIPSDVRKYLTDYRAKDLYKHKLNRGLKDAKWINEITSAHSEWGFCTLVNTFSAMCGFNKRVKPDFEKRNGGDLGDLRIGTITFDVKHRDTDYESGWFCDADYFNKKAGKFNDNTVFVYTTGLEQWKLNKFKKTDVAYELAVVGCFDIKQFNKKSQLKRNGERKVLDPPHMFSVMKLLTLIAKELAREEGYL